LGAVRPKQLRDAGLETWEFILHDVPDDFVVYRVVPVNHTISQAHDLPQLRDPIDQGRLEGDRSVECLADDAEAALDRVPHHPRVVAFVGRAVQFRRGLIKSCGTRPRP
jgi:hypothetical protein